MVEPALLGVDEVPNLLTALDRAATRWPDRVAWTFDPGETLTFAAVRDRAAALSRALAGRGIAAGDAVAVRLGNEAGFPLTWFALMMLGARMVALSPRYRSSDTEHVLRTAGCAAIVTAPAQVDDLTRLPDDVPGVRRILDVAELEADAPAAPVPTPVVTPQCCLNVQFTSGTSGRPKGCLLSHRYWLELGSGLVVDFPHLGGDDIMLTAQPFHYVDPQWNVVAALLAGARLVVLDGFHPQTFWAKVREHQVTYFYCLAAMPNLLLRTPPSAMDRDHRVRVVQCSAIPPGRHAEIEARWGVKWYEAFGMTETGGDLRVTDLDHDELVGSGCVGGPTRHREARVVNPAGQPVASGEVGELVLRGAGMMAGYLGDPEATAAAFRGGWFHTGDLARMDHAGRVWLAGRLKDTVRRAGENIAAVEVETVLMSHPDVEIAALMAVVDDIRGEEGKAVVVAAATVTPDSLLVWCQERLAQFKVPRYWEFRDSLPMTASQRVAKSALAGLPAVQVYDAATGLWS